MKIIAHIAFIVICFAATVFADAGGDNYNYIVSRNVFHPLWRTAIDSASQQDAARQKQFDQMQKDQQKKLEETRRQQEDQQRNAKKQQLEAQFEVTGIVQDGERFSALIQNKKDGKTYTSGVGDSVDDCTVTAIDSTKGEVLLKSPDGIAFRLSIK